MGKNVTIYLPDDIAEKMEKFPEVNWSEICRKAIVDYVETRSQTDLGAIIERLKKERSEGYRKGQLFMYGEVIPKLSWEKIEFLRKRVDARLFQEDPGMFGDERLGPVGAEHVAVQNMRFHLGRIAKELNVTIPKDLSFSSDDSFYQGAIDALMDVYNRVKGKKKAMSDDL